MSNDTEYELYFDDQQGAPCGWVLRETQYGKPRGYREKVHEETWAVGPSSEDLGTDDRDAFPSRKEAIQLAKDEIGIEL